MYVDDVNVLAEHPGMDGDAMETAAAGQQSITQWGETLMETGGNLKALKSHWGLHYQHYCKTREEWVYLDLDNDRDALRDVTIVIPQLDRTTDSIHCLGTNEPIVNLEVHICVNSSSHAHLSSIKEHITAWTATIREGTLATRAIWTGL